MPPQQASDRPMRTDIARKLSPEGPGPQKWKWVPGWLGSRCRLISPTLQLKEGGEGAGQDEVSAIICSCSLGQGFQANGSIALLSIRIS